MTQTVDVDCPKCGVPVEVELEYSSGGGETLEVLDYMAGCGCTIGGNPEMLAQFNEDAKEKFWKDHDPRRACDDEDYDPAY